MKAVLLLMAVQGALGAFDTAYYHEYKARLVAAGPRARPELWLHALRDFVYALLFATLPWVTWCGAWATVLATLLACEIAVTMADFAVEGRTRGPQGLAAGERVTHGLMAVVYGAMLGRLAPYVAHWRDSPTSFQMLEEPIPHGLELVLLAFAVGVFGSGLRDAYAAAGGRNGAIPWAKSARHAGHSS